MPVSQRRSPKQKVEDLKDQIATGKLSDRAINDIMLHCAAILAFRQGAKRLTGAVGLEAATVCYTQFPGDTTVSLWQNGFKVGACSLQDAQAKGLRPCG